MRLHYLIYSRHTVLELKALALLFVVSFLAAGCNGQMTQISPAVATVSSATSEPTSASSPEEMPALKKLPELTEEAVQSGLSMQGMPEVQWSDTPPCAETDCGALIMTQSGQPQRIDTGEQGLSAGAQLAPLPAELSEDGRWVIDTGQPSPDGKWVAYTSIGYESGGPIFLQNLESGEWSNLLAAVNQRLGSEAALPFDYWWDVIGWFPDSQRLMIGPGDASMVAIVNLSSSTARIIPFDGSGRGGRLFVNLAPDGERFIFTGEDGSGQQTFNAYDLASGEVTPVYTLSYKEGYISNPRFAPDGKSIAFVTQRGPAGTDVHDRLDLLPLDGGTARTLMEGSLWMAVPTWSPDGERLAFAMAERTVNVMGAKLPEGAEAAAVNPAVNPAAVAAGEETAFAPMRGNVWVVTTEGEAEQVTFIDGLARSPVWSKDSQTLAFVTHDGQVGLANADQPGQIWQASGPAAQSPELISAFFIP